MKRSVPRRGLLPHLFLPCLVLLAGPAARAAVWPTDPPPCDDISDLETCLLGVPSGEIVEIAANAIPGQTVAVIPGKSFTLRPAAGFAPVFGDFTSLFALGGAENITVVIEGLTLQRGTIRLRQGGSGTFDVTVRNNAVQQAAAFGAAILVDSSNTTPPYGPTLFLVEDNDITIDLAADDVVSAISVSGFQTGGNVGAIRGNVIDQVGGDQSAAINIGNGAVTLDVDILGNRISGSDFNAGVSLFQFASGGQLTARVINNVISGQVDEAGLPGAIALNVGGGDAEFTVVNNTVAFNENGLQMGGRADLGATASGVIANNIFAFNTEDGLAISSDFEATLLNEFNLVFGNGSNSFTPGPGTLTEDPLFVGPPGDLHLQTASPARNSGNDARVPADITTDIEGNPRIVGVVDRGAYESEAFLLEVPALSTWSAALLVGLLLAAGLLRARVV